MSTFNYVPLSLQARPTLYKLLILFVFFILQGCATTGPQQHIPKEIQARMDLANSYISKERPRLSLKELMTVQKRADKIPNYHFLLGITYMQLNEHNQAINHFQRAVNLKPTYAEAWNNLGQVYATKGQRAKAEEAFKRALDINTYLTQEFAAYNLAKLYWQKQQKDQAIKYARLALNKNRQYTPAYLLLSNIYLQKGDFDQATYWLEQGLQVNPKNLQFMLRLAENLLRSGKNSDAVYWFQQIIKTKPNSQIAKVAKDYLEILH